jgi:hypothetical protein
MMNLTLPKEIWAEIVPLTTPETLSALSRINKEFLLLVSVYKIEVALSNRGLTIWAKGEFMKTTFDFNIKLFDNDSIEIITSNLTPLEEKICKIGSCVHKLLSNWVMSFSCVKTKHLKEIEVLLKLSANPKEYNFLLADHGDFLTKNRNRDK